MMYVVEGADHPVDGLASVRFQGLISSISSWRKLR